MVAAITARTGMGGPSDARAAGAAPVVDQPTAAPSVEPPASLPPQLINPATGQKIWWTVGGPLKVSNVDALTRPGQKSDDTACPNGQECPDPLAP